MLCYQRMEGIPPFDNSWEIRSSPNQSAANDFSEHWTNNFNNLSCVYFENGDHWNLAFKNVTNNATNYSYDQEMVLLTRVCLNGSFADLSDDEWNRRCYPSYWDNVTIRRVAGVWSLFNFIVGILGNTLTFAAVAYARKKHRHVTLILSTSIINALIPLT